MNTRIIRGVEVTRPTTTPLNSSVLDHATVVEPGSTGSFGWTNNAGLWPSYNCLDTLAPTALCADPQNTKTFSFAEWVPAFEIAVYGGIQCSNVGLDREDMLAEAKRVFGLNEGKGVEQGLLGNRFVASDSDAPVQWDAPVDLSVNGNLLQTIGVLEGYAAALYAGVPTLHMPRSLITMGAGQGALVERDGKFYTKAGSKVAAGGGYDSQDVPTGEFDVYATGEVYVEKSEEVNANAYTLPGSIARQAAQPGYVEADDPNKFTDNTSIVLVERMFRIAVDCFVAKATAVVW